LNHEATESHQYHPQSADKTQHNYPEESSVNLAITQVFSAPNPNSEPKSTTYFLFDLKNHPLYRDYHPQYNLKYPANPTQQADASE
jgi:hypothetical protein